LSEIRVTTISDTAGTGPVTLTKQSAAKAWVSFNGNTDSIKSTFNISSLTDNATGDYSVTLINAMSNATYSYNGTSSNWETTNSDSYMTFHGYEGGQTASVVRCITIRQRYDAIAQKDPKTVNINTHGDLA